MGKATAAVSAGIHADGLTWNLAEAPLVRLPREPRDFDRTVAEFKRPDETLIIEGVETRPVPGMSGRYRAGRDGSIWSDMKGEWRRLSLQPTEEGRLLVRLRIDGRETRLLMAGVVLRTFGTPPPPGSEVGYRDGDRANIALNNLEWVPCGIAQRGRSKPPHARGERHASARLREADVIEARALYRSGWAGAGVARRYGVDESTMRQAIRGETGSHVPGAVSSGEESGGGGERHASARLREADVIEARALYRSGWAATDLARRYGVNKATMQKAIRGKTWSHVPGAVPAKGGR